MKLLVPGIFSYQVQAIDGSAMLFLKLINQPLDMVICLLAVLRVTGEGREDKSTPGDSSAYRPLPSHTKPKPAQQAKDFRLVNPDNI